MQQAQYQLIIVGGGPAGLTAGLYAARGRLKVLLVEKGATGGQVLVTDWVDNYPGFVEGASGYSLVDKMTAHADRFGLERKFATISSLDLTGDIKSVFLENGEVLTAKTIILCTGAKPRKLGIPGEYEFTGRGVSYCATCDGPFYRNQDIAIIGGGDTATKEAIYLSKIARKVYLVHRRGELRAEKVLQERALARPNMEFLWFHRPLEIQGDKSGVTRLVIESIETKEKKTLDLMGVFVFVGVVPNTGFVDCAKDGAGFITVDEKLESSIPGLFAVGDCRVTPLRQVAVAVGDGAIAATMAEEHVSAMEGHLYAGKAVKG